MEYPHLYMVYIWFIYGLQTTKTIRGMHIQVFTSKNTAFYPANAWV